MAKNKFFKFFALACCACTVPVLAGCTLVTTNTDKYLAETVASFDNGRITVNREELLITYNTTGNSRFDDSSTPTEEGVRDTIDLELKRKLLVEFLTSDAEDMVAARQAKHVDKITLSTYQLNTAWQNVYDYINSTVDSIATDLRAADGLTKEEAEEDSSSYTSYYDSLYDKKYTLVINGNQAILQKVADEVEVANQSIALYTDADLENKKFSELAEQAYDTFRQKYWHWTDSILLNPDATNEKSYSDEAWSDHINNLLRSENERNLTKVGADAFLRNVQMVYNIYYQNAVLSAFQEKYTEQALNVTAKDVADKYKELYDAQYEKYNSDTSAFDSKVSTGAGEVYYMQKANSYIKVNHILVKFSEEQNAALEAEKTKLANSEIDVATYKRNVANIKKSTTGYNRETGERVGIDEIYNQIVNAVSGTSSSSEKIAKFADLMHIYSEDDATLGAEACYYIPTDLSITDSMQKAFADNSRELYNDGKGKVGDISSHWVETSYGYHIIMYTGLPTNVDSSDSTLNLVTKLDAYRLNPLYNKTMLDKMIEQVTLAEYADYEESIADYLMADKKIEYFPGSFSDMYNK